MATPKRRVVINEESKNTEVDKQTVKNKDGNVDEDWNKDIVDLSDRGLENLTIIAEKEKASKSGKLRLTTIILNNNQLRNLEGLSRIVTLVKIEAKDNVLTEARLKLINLTYLDLSRNRLSQVPPLENLPRIQTLILRMNQIRSIKQKLSMASFTLMTLDLSFNEIDSDSAEVKEFLDELKTLERVRNINILGNPIMKKFSGIWRYIVKELGTQLTKLNEEQIRPQEVQLIKEQPLKDLETLANQESEEEVEDNRKSKSTIKRSEIKPGKVDKLTKMLRNLELASTTPTRCVEYITKIARTANKVINMQEMGWEKIFFSENPKKRMEINEKIDSFLENCVIMIENQHSVQNTMLNSLASLTVISTNNFGKRCLLLLGDFLNPGISRQLQSIIKKKLKLIVIPNLHQKKLQDLALPVLEGLSQVIIDEDLGSLFIESCPFFIGWIKEIHRESQIENNFQGIQIQKLHKSILDPKKVDITRIANINRLLSKISMNQSVSKELITLGISKYISGIFRSFIRKDYKNFEIYLLLYTLKLIQNTANLGRDIATEYIEAREAKVSVIDDIKTSIMIWMDAYKGRNYDLKDPQDPPETQKLKYMLFSSLISTFGTLAHYLSNDKLNLVLQEFGYKLLGYAAHPKTEPLLLTSICEFAYGVITSEAGKHSRTCIENVFNSLQRLLPLMLYMGDTYAPHLSAEKYRFLCLSAELYHKGTMLKSEAVPLEGNTNPIVHKLFIAIIRLITFICRNANIPCNIQEKCQEYSAILNENGRETILFSCLQIPNDDVKLAIAKCLDEVNVKEIEVDEMAYFSRLLSTYKNLGAGKTEEVLSLIFIIMTKVLRDNGTSAREFVNKYSQNAIGDALDILVRNMERNLKNEPEEQEEKVDLSLSCIYFLRAASENPTIRVFMVDQNALTSMKKSLYYEQELMRNYPIPIEIESTYIGRNMEYLFRCTTGQESLSPDSIVSYRIIARIADLLMGIKEISYETLAGEDAVQILRDKVRADFKQKLKMEIANWEIFEGKTRNDFLKLNENDKESLAQQHKLISSFDGLNRLLLFIIKKEAGGKTEDKHYQLTLNDEFLKKINSLQLKAMRKKPGGGEGDSAFGKKTKNSFKNQLQAELERHALSHNQIDKKEIARLILEPPSKSTIEAGEVAPTQKRVDDPGSIFAEVITNPTIDDDRRVRIFVVSGVMRVIYAAVTFFIDPETKRRALQQIKNIQVLQPLTELCASIGWAESNVATKYFEIMYFLLEELQFETDEILIIDIFDILSKVVADVLKLLRRKIQNVEKVPLAYEDEVLILKMTFCCSLMCARLASMQLLREADKKIIIKVIEEQNKDSNGHSLSGLKPEAAAKQIAVKFLLSRLIPLHVIYGLLDIIFINMSKYSSAGGNVKMNEYAMSELTNKGLAFLLGEYLTNCLDYKYSILKYFTDAEIYGSRYVRQTFLQEILITEQMFRLRNNLNEYCRDKGYSETDGREGFKEVLYVEIIEVGKKVWGKKILGVTNNAVYVFSPSKKTPCSLCPPASLCPEGPSLDMKILFNDVSFVVDFIGAPRIGVSFTKNEGVFSKFMTKHMKKDTQMVISFNSMYDQDVVIYSLKTYGITVVSDKLLAYVLGNQIETPINENHYYTYAVVPSDVNKNLTRDSYYDEKRVLLLTPEDLIIFKENVEYWVVDIDSGGHHDDEIQKLDDESKKKLADLDARKKASLFMLKKIKEIHLSSIESFTTEDNGVPIGEIKMGKENIKLLFGLDPELERFRVELFRRIAKSKLDMKVEIYTALRSD